MIVGRALSVAAAVLGVAGAKSWPFGKNIKNLVQFGDSYTDSTVWIATNGTTWGQYLASYAGLELHNFAISGAICDNSSTPRTNFPDIKKDELNAYYNYTKQHKLNPEETLYTIWIGTNDIGAGELLTGQATPGISIVNVSRCAVDVVQTLYKAGARKFLFQNLIPLDEAPMYAKNAWPDRYWTASRNATNWNIFMKELVAAGNALTSYMIRDLAPTLKGSTIGYFDSFGLFHDMYTHPTQYFNGTAPANVTGAVRACVLGENSDTGSLGACTLATGKAVDSFMWADELHPSEQSDRKLAQQLFKIYQGKSDDYVTFYHH